MCSHCRLQQMWHRHIIITCRLYSSSWQQKVYADCRSSLGKTSDRGGAVNLGDFPCFRSLYRRNLYVKQTVGLLICSLLTYNAHRRIQGRPGTHFGATEKRTKCYESTQLSAGLRWVLRTHAASGPFVK